MTFVREAIARHNVAVTRETYYSPLAVFLRDERDPVMGGAFGEALQPANMDLDRDEGRYEDSNVWMLHPVLRNVRRYGPAGTSNS